MIPDKAFILAAGYGSRMRPLTDTLPKPLAEIAGRSLLERTLDQLEASGIRDVMINTHYLGNQIENRLQGRINPRIRFSQEGQLLDTGGGIYKTLDFFKGQEFLVVSGDGFWTDGPQPALSRLSSAWNSDRMDILIMLQPLSTFSLTEGTGDYNLLPDGKAVRSLTRTGTHMFTSMRINHPRIFNNAPQCAFSYLTLLDKAEKEGRLYALVHDAEWHHISTMQDLQAVNNAFGAAS